MSACADSNESDDTTLVFAAASLSDALTEVGSLYTLQTGNTATFSFGGSNLLANQILTGAPANVIFSAGYTPMQRLIQEGRIESESVSELLSNDLVVVKHKSDTENQDVNSAQTLAGRGRIAVPDPEIAPAGEYAASWLQSKDAWNLLRDQIIPTLDVRAATAAVASRNADWAIVYRTDAISEDAVQIAFTPRELPPDAMPIYYVAQIQGDDSGADFIHFLHSQPALNIFQDKDFKILTESSPSNQP